MKYLKMILSDAKKGLTYLFKTVGMSILLCAATLSALFTIVIYGERFLLHFITFLGFPPFVISTRGADDMSIVHFGTGVILGLMAFLGYQRYKYARVPWYRVIAEIIGVTILVIAAVLALLVLILGLCGVTLPFIIEWSFSDKTFVEAWDALGTGKQILGSLGTALVLTPIGALIGLYGIELKRRGGANE